MFNSNSCAWNYDLLGGSGCCSAVISYGSQCLHTRGQDVENQGGEEEEEGCFDGGNVIMSWRRSCERISSQSLLD